MSYDWLEAFDCITLTEGMRRILEATAEEFGNERAKWGAKKWSKSFRGAALMLAITDSVNRVMREEGLLHITPPA